MRFYLGLFLVTSKLNTSLESSEKYQQFQFSREIAQEEVDHLFAESDDDHDDLLSYHEVIEHYETFVGSEATDYGDQLYKNHHFSDEL